MSIDEHEKEVVLNSYSQMVLRVAKSACYSSSAIDINDLCQVGEIAVLRAIKAYDPSSGTNIKSFVRKIVRRDIYKEAGRFLGVFTVDHRVTSLAAKVHKLSCDGHTDHSIANMTNIDIDQVRDLRIAYNRRYYTAVDDDNVLEKEHSSERTIRDMLNSVTHTDNEHVILQLRILGTEDVSTVAQKCNIPVKKVYQIESSLKDRVRCAIEDCIE